MTAASGHKRYPTWLFAVMALAIGMAAPLLLAEIVLQFTPVIRNLYAQTVDARHPILRYEPNRDFTYSIGPMFDVVVRGRINNAGWVNDQDYDSTATSPLLAVVGDSYVEALMVPYSQTVNGRLARDVDGRGRVYSFGMSGAPLSQYLVMSDYVRHGYRPRGEIVVIVGNDFDESLLKYKRSDGLWGFREDSSHLTLERVDYHPARWKRLLRKSAVVRYVVMNLHLPATFDRMRAPRAMPNTYAGNVKAQADSVRIADSKRVVDEFLSRLPHHSGLATDHIALVVDGVRPQLYDARQRVTADATYFGVMRRYLMDAARERGYVVVDLQPRFVRRFEVERRHFEFPSDGHWNALGHEEAAKAIEESPLLARVFGGG